MQEVRRGGLGLKVDRFASLDWSHSPENSTLLPLTARVAFADGFASFDWSHSVEASSMLPPIARVAFVKPFEGIPPVIRDQARAQRVRSQYAKLRSISEVRRK